MSSTTLPVCPKTGSTSPSLTVHLCLHTAPGNRECALFDRLSRDHLLRFLEHRIGDNRVLRLITKWLNAGVMEDGEWKDDLQGTPQGAVVSPILANVYLHYVLDLWFQKKWRARKATGDTIIVRYADDCAPRRRRGEAEMAT